MPDWLSGGMLLLIGAALALGGAWVQQRWDRIEQDRTRKRELLLEMLDITVHLRTIWISEMPRSNHYGVPEETRFAVVDAFTDETTRLAGRSRMVGDGQLLDATMKVDTAVNYWITTASGTQRSEEARLYVRAALDLVFHTIIEANARLDGPEPYMTRFWKTGRKQRPD
jgi:hypothetical protein